jgi:hypothetical protein
MRQGNVLKACGDSTNMKNFKNGGAKMPGEAAKAPILTHESVEAFRTFPSAISLKATTTSRLSEAMRGFAPLKSCLARLDASMTSSKRLETFLKQSSTVIRDMIRPPNKSSQFKQI